MPAFQLQRLQTALFARALIALLSVPAMLGCSKRPNDAPVAADSPPAASAPQAAKPSAEDELKRKLFDAAVVLSNNRFHRILSGTCDLDKLNTRVKTATIGTMSAQAVGEQLEPGTLPAIIAQVEYRCFDRSLGRDTIDDTSWLTFALDEKFEVARCINAIWREADARKSAQKCGFEAIATSEGRSGSAESARPAARSGETTAGADSVMTREQFRTAVMGKTAEQVIAAVGRPESTSDYSTVSAWYYEKKTKDPITGKIDISAQVLFDKETGRVRSVSF